MKFDSSAERDTKSTTNGCEKCRILLSIEAADDDDKCINMEKHAHTKYFDLNKRKTESKMATTWSVSLFGRRNEAQHRLKSTTNVWTLLIAIISRNVSVSRTCCLIRWWLPLYRFLLHFFIPINQRFYIPNLLHTGNRTLEHIVHLLRQFSTVFFSLLWFVSFGSAILISHSFFLLYYSCLFFCFFFIIYGENVRMNRIEMQLTEYEAATGTQLSH